MSNPTSIAPKGLSPIVPTEQSFPPSVINGTVHYGNIPVVTRTLHNSNGYEIIRCWQNNKRLGFWTKPSESIQKCNEELRLFANQLENPLDFVAGEEGIFYLQQGKIVIAGYRKLRIDDPDSAFRVNNFLLQDGSKFFIVGSEDDAIAKCWDIAKTLYELNAVYAKKLKV